MSEFEPALTTVPSPTQIDDAWIALLVGAIIIFIVSLIAILILCLFWHRYKRRGPYPTEAYVLGNKPNSTRPMAIPIEPYQPPDNYETQRMEVFVPPGEDDRMQRNFGEYHARFSPEDGIQDMHQFQQRTTKAYF